MPQLSVIDSTINKLIKALPNLLLFTNEKDLSINQWLLKIQDKFEINWDYYLSKRSKLIYIENKVGDKDL